MKNIEHGLNDNSILINDTEKSLGRLEGAINSVENLTRSNVGKLLFVILSIGSSSGCAIKMHTVETDMGVEDTRSKTKVEDLGPVIKSASTDGTSLSLSAEVIQQCTDQKFETHVIRSHLVPDGSRLPWMIVSSVGFSAAALGGLAIANNAPHNDGNDHTASLGTALFVVAGVPAVAFDLSLIRTFGRMGSHKDRELEVLTKKSKPYPCEDSDPYTGQATMTISDVSGNPLSTQTEFEFGESSMPDSDIPLSFWLDPEWTFKLDTKSTIAMKKGAQPVQVVVEGNVEEALQVAVKADELRKEKEARVREIQDATERQMEIDKAEVEHRLEMERIHKLALSLAVDISIEFTQDRNVSRESWQAPPTWQRNGFGDLVLVPGQWLTDNNLQYNKHGVVNGSIHNNNSRKSVNVTYQVEFTTCSPAEDFNRTWSVIIKPGQTREFKKEVEFVDVRNSEICNIKPSVVSVDEI